MTVTELLETVRRVELRTNRLVNDTMVGAYLSHFKGRGMDVVSVPPHPGPLPQGRGIVSSHLANTWLHLLLDGVK